MKIQVKVRKNRTLYTFIVETKENYKGNVGEMDEEKRWFLNQIKQEMEKLE